MHSFRESHCELQGVWTPQEVQPKGEEGFCGCRAGVENPSATNGRLGIYNITRGPHNMINLQISLLEIDSTSSPAFGCPGRASPDDCMGLRGTFSTHSAHRGMLALRKVGHQLGLKGREVWGQQRAVPRGNTDGHRAAALALRAEWHTPGSSESTLT